MFRKLISGIAGRCSDGRDGLADTLREALVSAYQTNPTLTAQRQALAGNRCHRGDRQGRRAGRRSARRLVSTGTSPEAESCDTAGRARPSRVGADFSYPLFNGGSVKNSVRAAETRVEAGRATLRAVEGDVFTAGGRGLHGRDPRPRDRRAEPEQCQGPRDQSAGDARPLPDRRPHPHRRRPVRSAAAARPLAARASRRAG